MKTVMAIRHIHFEDLGLFEPILTQLDFQVEYVDAPLAQFSDLDVLSPEVLVVLGAPIGAFDEEAYPFLQAEFAAIKQRIDANKPLLGVCLGGQLIARALGAEVAAMGHKEIGFSSLSYTAAGAASALGLMGDCPVLHWHGDQFAIPEYATLLASTDLCPHQAFAYQNHVLALQCHLEADPAKIEAWLVGHACELAQAKVNVHAVRADAARYGTDLQQGAARFLNQWLREQGLVTV